MRLPVIDGCEPNLVDLAGTIPFWEQSTSSFRLQGAILGPDDLVVGEGLLRCWRASAPRGRGQTPKHRGDVSGTTSFERAGRDGHAQAV